MDWHEQFKQWAKPPTDVEEAKASKAAELINKAVRETQILAGVNFKVYPTGSYRNNTNIKLGSDVDVALVLTDAIYSSLPEGLTTADVGLGRDATYGMAEFRRDVGRALAVQFGGAVTPGTKTFRIAANESRLPADATPFLVHRQYTGRRDAQGRWEYHEGVELRPTDVPTRRIIDYAKYGVRSASNPYIGRLNNTRVRAALQATLEGFLTSMVEDEALTGFDLAVTATRAQEISGEVSVVMTLQPTFSIDYIRVVMNLR